MIELGAGRPAWVLGLMSGTSMDGVDAALVLTDGETVSGFGPSGFLAYERTALRALPAMMEDPLRYARRARGEDRQTVAEAAAEVTRLHARGVVDLLSGVAAGHQPVVVAFPGQTVAHYPEKGWTWQIGDGGSLARALNRPVVWDFRSDDVRAGGQGAPLVPFYHFALAQRIGATEPLAFLNIGGVANVTWVDPRRASPEEEGALVAFDTGPGNALVNDWMLAHTRQPVDVDGALAARGNARAVTLGGNFVTEFLDRRPPKSLDRNEFAMLTARLEGLSPADGAAVLTAFTADCAAAAARHFPQRPSRWLVCGGGRRNATMMRMLSERIEAPIDPVEAVGLDGDMLEAQAFAYLAARVVRGLPTSAPSTTGCGAPVCGGILSHPARSAAEAAEAEPADEPAA